MLTEIWSKLGSVQLESVAAGLGVWSYQLLYIYCCFLCSPRNFKLIRLKIIFCNRLIYNLFFHRTRISQTIIIKFKSVT